jgi:hypothetical protein
VLLELPSWIHIVTESRIMKSLLRQRRRKVSGKAPTATAMFRLSHTIQGRRGGPKIYDLCLISSAF